jgi:transcriptional regulator with XRE-family HTH domain
MLSSKTCPIVGVVQMKNVRSAVGDELRRAIRDRGLTVDEAAKQLGVSRQAFHSYLNGSSLMRPARLDKAVEMWDLHLKIDKTIFGKLAFQKVKAEGFSAIQMSLWDALDSITQDDLKITVKRVGASLRVAVHIQIPA